MALREHWQKKSEKSSLQGKTASQSLGLQNLEFHGVMRFYLEDGVGENVATKCLRVCSSSSTLELIDTLSEKFRPDMKTLSARFALYEIHADKGQHRPRRLSRPLWMQIFLQQPQLCL